jgi:hypothetical protein
MMGYFIGRSVKSKPGSKIIKTFLFRQGYSGQATYFGEKNNQW